MAKKIMTRKMANEKGLQRVFRGYPINKLVHVYKRKNSLSKEYSPDTILVLHEIDNGLLNIREYDNIHHIDEYEQKVLSTNGVIDTWRNLTLTDVKNEIEFKKIF